MLHGLKINNQLKKIGFNSLGIQKYNNFKDIE